MTTSKGPTLDDSNVEAQRMEHCQVVCLWNLYYALRYEKQRKLC